jgi:hypothetical protein
VPGSDYLEGLIFFAPTLAFATGGAWLLRSRRFSHLRGPDLIAALGMLLVLGLLAIHVLPLALGVLSRGTVLAAAALWLGACALVPTVESAPDPTPREASDVGRAGQVLSAITVALVSLLALAVARDQLFASPLAVDTLHFHLPGVAAWIQSGSLWQIDVFLPDAAPGHYPQNGSVVLLAAVLPWSNDFLSHLAHYPIYLLTGVATYALARELRAPAATAAVVVALLLATPAVLVPALIAGYPDILALFGFAVGLLFLVRHHRNDLTCELVLAGLALGVAFGTKWYSVPAVAAVVAVWGVGSIASGRGWRTVARQGLVLIAMIALAGGIWLVRNWVESGNPVFPVRVAPLGIEVFDAPRDVVREAGGFTLADYVGDPAVWTDHALPQYRDVVALSGAVLLLAFVLAAVLVALPRWRDAPARGLVLAGAVAGGLILVLYAITPYTAGGPAGMPDLVGPNSRYAVPALVIAAVLCAWAAGRLPRGTVVVAALGVLGVVDAAVRVSDSGLTAASVDRGDWQAAIAFAVVVGGGIWVASRGWSRLEPRHRRVALVVAGCVGLLAAAAAGYETQKRYNHARYAGQDPTVDHILRRVPEGRRVGLAGTWDNGIPPVLPAFGPRLRNHVVYLGFDDDDYLRRYTERGAFVRSLRDGGYDYLFVGHGIPRRSSLREERWAESAGFEEVARSDRLTLLRAPS